MEDRISLQRRIILSDNIENVILKIVHDEEFSGRKATDVAYPWVVGICVIDLRADAHIHGYNIHQFYLYQINHSRSRQGKSLDWKWTSIFDKIVKKGQRGILVRNSSPIIKAIITVVEWPHIATNHRGSRYCTVAFENLLQSIIQIKGYQIWNEGVF